MPGACSVRLTRRGILAAGTIALAGCLGDETAEPPDPIDLQGQHFCDYCGMDIEAQPGPVGEAFFDGDIPSDREGPAWFCSGQCTYNYLFEQEATGVDAVVVYLTDYSAVSWSVSAEDDLNFLSAHLEADAFGNAQELTLLVDSDLRGAMGPDLIGFSEESEADEVRENYGGSLYHHDEVTPELVAALTG